MKPISLLILIFSIMAARAESTNAPAVAAQSTNAPAMRAEPSFPGEQGTGIGAGGTNAPMAGPLDSALSTELSKKIEPSNIILLQPKPNETTLGQVKVSGIAIEAAKTGPLKLINPFSPPANSSPEDNVVRDPFNGKVNGLKVFAVHF